MRGEGKANWERLPVSTQPNVRERHFAHLGSHHCCFETEGEVACFWGSPVPHVAEKRRPQSSIRQAGFELVSANQDECGLTVGYWRTARLASCANFRVLCVPRRFWTHGALLVETHTHTLSWQAPTAITMLVAEALGHFPNRRCALSFVPPMMFASP